MIPRYLEELVPARSFGLLEDCGQGKTDIDQSDGDDDFVTDCEKMYPPKVAGQKPLDNTI